MYSLPFSSPTINIEWDKNEYVKFISDLRYYLNQPLKCEREANFEKEEWPIGSLGENDRQVRMKLVHNSSFEEAKQQWERRSKRINFDNIFVKFGFDRSDDWELCMKTFDKLKYNKICFLNGGWNTNGHVNSAVYKQWLCMTCRGWNGRVDSFNMSYTLGDPHVTQKVFDVLAMLNGELNYFRNSDMLYNTEN